MKDKYVVWGTGNITRELLEKYEELEVSFFVDNDESKKGKTFYGKRIWHPIEVRDWGDVFVIISTVAYKQIENQLIQYGLKKDIDYALYFEYLEDIGFEGIEDKIEESIFNIPDEYNKKILIFNDIALKKENEKKYFLKMQKMSDEFEAVFVIEEIEKKYLDDNHIKGIVRPAALSRVYYSRAKKNCQISDEIKKTVECDKVLKKAVTNLRLKSPDMQKYYEYALVYYYREYIYKLLKKISPKAIFIRNTFEALNSIVEEVCISLGVEVVHTEMGVITGTLTFDFGGEMGRSYPTLYSKKFKQLQISEEEISEAYKIWEYIATTNMNRKVQYKLNLEESVIKRIDNKKPTILYAGQYDFSSGIQPYDEISQKFHSPFLKSSLEGAIMLATIAEKNEWNFIYKPHPAMNLLNERYDMLPKSVIVAEGIGINYLIELADVTITILSQTAYDALIRNKPVVMLGYMQLKNKGCTYEAFEEEKVEESIYMALKNGFTKEQKEAFAKHIAQVCKYYVYDDEDERTLRYGRKMPKTWDDLKYLKKEMEI